MSPAIENWFRACRQDSACGTVTHNGNPPKQAGVPDRGPANAVEEFAKLSVADRVEIWTHHFHAGQRNGLQTQMTARGLLGLLRESGLA